MLQVLLGIMFTHAVPLLFDPFVSHVMVYAFLLPSDFLSISIVHAHHFHHIQYRKYLFNYIVPNIHVIDYKVDVKVFVHMWLRI